MNGIIKTKCRASNGSLKTKRRGRINLFYIISSDPDAGASVLSARAKKCNFSFFIPEQYICLCQVHAENMNFILKRLSLFRNHLGRLVKNTDKPKLIALLQPGFDKQNYLVWISKGSCQILLSKEEKTPGINSFFWRSERQNWSWAASLEWIRPPPVRWKPIYSTHWVSEVAAAV